MPVLPASTDSASADRSLGLQIDLPAREVRLSGRLLELTRTEFDLLALLAAEPRRVFTSEFLLAELWATSFVGSGHPIEVYISRLRRKLGESGRNPHYVHTVRGVGYRYEPDQDPHESVVLGYDREGVLRVARTGSQNVWGWSRSEILGTKFNPTCDAPFNNSSHISRVVGSLTRLGVDTLHLITRIQHRNGCILPATAQVTLEEYSVDAVSVSIAFDTTA